MINDLRWYYYHFVCIYVYTYFFISNEAKQLLSNSQATAEAQIENCLLSKQFASNSRGSNWKFELQIVKTSNASLTSLQNCL